MDLNNNLQLVDVGTINSNGIADVQEDVQDVNSQEKIQGFSRNDDLCFTPNGTRYYVPNVPVECKPVEGSLWNSIDEALAMYENYAKIAGFTVRKSTTKSNADGEYKLRYLLCNREGQPKNNMAVDTLKEQPISKQPNGDGSNAKDKVPRKKRNSNFIVCGCTARIKLKYIKSASCFELYGFEESHNHELVTDENKHLTRAQRQLQFEDQIFFHLVGMNNIGPTKAHRLRAFLKGGYDKVHGTVVDWKNHKRDLNSFIGEYDAQMLLDKFESRKLNCPEFSFEFKADKDELVGLFWADETSKCNYREFGDVLAFDATYRTNKYCMIFVPFTGIDHHNKCVTFGAGLIKHEDIESYSWLLKAFLKAHIKQPTLVLTDQDAAMKRAVKTVMKSSAHRLCMWHIMKKLPAKVCGDILENTDFRKRLHKIVWDVLLTKEKFETRWAALMEEFNLQNNKWLANKFAIRREWVPGYFMDLPMCCVMKTTSRAESSNAFFRLFVDPSHTLVQFMICFESAMEKQRHSHQVLDHQTKETTPKFLTPLQIEVHASNVYTRAIFLKVQKEIFRSVWFCSQKFVPSDDGTEVTHIIDVNPKTKVVSNHKVVQNELDGSIVCSCNLWGRHGWLCRHVFCVLKSYQVNEIPTRYISKRWTRDVLPVDLLDNRHRYGIEHSTNISLCNEAISDVEACVSRLRHHPEKLASFVDKIKLMTSEVLVDIPEQSASKNKEMFFSELLGVTKPDKILVRAPPKVQTKGSGSKKRIPGKEEKYVQKRKRLMRLCKKCGVTQDTHDTRNCDKWYANQKKQKVKHANVGRCSHEH